LVWAAMLAVLALPLVDVAASASRDPAADIGDTLGAPLIAVPSAWWTSVEALLVLWTLWAAMNLARLARSIAWVYRVKQAATPIPAGRQARLSHWSSLRTQGRATSMVVSSGIRSAAVVGCGAPVIVIAPSLLDELADDELDRIVIHEWAHVQRRDDVIQLLQACIRVVAGWHPAVWWLDRQLCIEREIACDERAVAATGSPKGYASTLVKLAGLPAVRPLMHPELTAIAATGLRRRIARIVSSDRCRSPRGWRAAAAGSGVALCLLAAHVAEVRAFAASRATPVAPDAPRVAPQAIERRAAAGSPLAEPVALVRPSPPLVPPPTREQRGSPLAPPAASAGEASESSATGVAGAASVLNPEPISASRISAAFSADRAPSVSSAAAPVAVPAPWQAAADGGVALARQSREAAVASAGFFTRVGKRIASSF
jgi:beta-lactamase regulating signal transducer with metallopeptidase domain